MSAEKGLKPMTIWRARPKPAPAGWHYCDMTRCLVRNDGGSQITDQWIETMPALVSRERPSTEHEWFHAHCMRAGLNPSDLYQDTGKRP